MKKILIKNAKIVDGTGSDMFLADLLIEGDTIKEIGKITCVSGDVIDAAGRLLIPGFIDPHSHVDVGIFNREWCHQRITQGITTDIIGLCGPTPAPNCEKYNDILRRIYFELTGTGKDFPWTWQDMKGWIDAVGSENPTSNIAFLVGHSTIRVCVLGGEKRKADSNEIKKMQEILDSALRQGASGLSLGLSYFPGAYADTEEIIALAEIVKKHNGLISAHRRDEADKAYESVEEMIEVARATGVRMNLSHVKVMGKKNWGSSGKILKLIDKSKNEGLQITLDAYPYSAGYIQLFAIMPFWVWSGGPQEMLKIFTDPVKRKLIKKELSDGTADGISKASGGSSGIRIIQCPDSSYDMKTLKEISDETGMAPAECAIKVIEECGPGVMIFYLLQDQAELDSIITWQSTVICSDGTPSSGHGHPRYIGTFNHVLDYYVKTKGKITLQEAVHKMTGKTAEYYNIPDRGIIKEGNKADLVIIDWDRFEDLCTYDRPLAGAKGIDYVILNGEIAAENGVYTGSGRGCILSL